MNSNLPAPEQPSLDRSNSVQSLYDASNRRLSPSEKQPVELNSGDRAVNEIAKTLKLNKEHPEISLAHKNSNHNSQLPNISSFLSNDSPMKEIKTLLEAKLHPNAPLKPVQSR
jgi:hypothetical protein